MLMNICPILPLTVALTLLFPGLMSTTIPQSKIVDKPEAEFEVATVKLHVSGGGSGGGCRGIDSRYPPGRGVVPPLGRCVINNANLPMLMSVAYSMSMSPGPDHHEFRASQEWMTSDRWDMQAKAPDANRTEFELRQMLQRLLRERFKVQFHHETKESNGYALMVARGGPKIKEEHSDSPGGFVRGPNKLIFKNAPISTLVAWLIGFMQGNIVDKTGLMGTYTFDLTLPQREFVGGAASSDPGGSIFTILPEELGLRLESQKLTVDVVVIDQAQRPPEN